MSALWTPGRAGVSPRGSWWHSPAPAPQVHPHPLPPDRRLRRGPEAMVQRRLRPESARVGLLHEGRDPLTKGCAYCTKAPPTRSTPNPRPVAPHPRAVHPDDTGGHAVDADSNDYRLLRSPGRRLGQRRVVSEAGAVGAHLEGDLPVLGLRGEALDHGDERLRLVQTRKRLQGEQVDPLPRQDLGPADQTTEPARAPRTWQIPKAFALRHSIGGLRRHR